MLEYFDICLSIVTGVFSVLTFLFVTLGGYVIPKTVRLHSISPHCVKFKVRLRNYNVQQLTNIVSACYYGGGTVPPCVRNEIIELTASHGIKNCKKVMRESNEQNKANMLVNLSNHPNNQWSKEQLDAAAQYGPITDLPFPDINPEGDEQYIDDLANQYLQKVLDMIPSDSSATVHLMGEMNFTIALHKQLQQHGITCVASTTQRLVEQQPDGSKKVKFQFVKFRRYE